MKAADVAALLVECATILAGGVSWRAMYASLMHNLSVALIDEVDILYPRRGGETLMNRLSDLQMF